MTNMICVINSYVYFITISTKLVCTTTALISLILNQTPDHLTHASKLLK